ncbi:transposase [Thiohalocapsa sp.]|uniref:IS66 family insertion sequence element accessory protein TnpA n=1 Tax=Thiohalocapsa sp. TaxID=2497641 RepID=UPI0025D4D98A|nr:transposase [Thiohalocapsa sp.]
MNHRSDRRRRARRVRRSAEQWSELIEAQSTSGRSIAAFCRERGLSANSFYRWRRRLEASASAGSQRRAFVRLRMSGAGQAATRRWAEAGGSDRDMVVVRFVDGVELEVSGDRLGEVLAWLRAGSIGGLA